MSEDIKPTLVLWHPVGNCGKVILWGHDLGDNTAVRHEGAAIFVPPEGASFQADALRAIADALDKSLK